MKNRAFIISFTTLLAGLHISSWASDNKTNNDLLAKSISKVSGFYKNYFSFTQLYSFQGSDGKQPYAGLVYAESYGGYLYGTTTQGGPYNSGTIYMISPDGNKKSTLYGFIGGSDGANPYASLIQGNDANTLYLYGTTKNGGTKNYGTVFQMDIYTKQKKILYNFQGGTDGANPIGKLTFGYDGNLYGTTLNGGSGVLCGANGCGTIYMITPDGTKKTLYKFQGGADGANPLASLMLNPVDGNLYGTTRNGGAMNYGTVFKINPTSYEEKTLYSFQGGKNDGSYPYSELIQVDYMLYGTTAYGGGFNDGTIYNIDSYGNEAVLYNFSGIDGSNPAAPLIKIPEFPGFYGTTVVGGNSNNGTVFKIESE